MGFFIKIKCIFFAYKKIKCYTTGTRLSIYLDFLKMNSRNNINKILSSAETLERILTTLPTSIEDTKDITNLSVWWILNKTDKNNLLRLVSYFKKKKKWLLIEDYEEYDPIFKRELIKIWIKLVRFIDSIWNSENYSLWYLDISKLHNKMDIPWNALEYFLIDQIIRINKKSINKVKVEKWPSELEGKKVDFMLNTAKNIKLWIQLTLSEWYKIPKKQKELSISAYKIESDLWEKKWKKGMSSKFIPDVPVLVIVNSELSKEAYNNDILSIAFNKWKENWFKSWWPSQYLSENIRKELAFISLNLSENIEEAFKFIKAIYLHNQINIDKIHEKQIGNLHIIYDSWNKVIISYYDRDKNWKLKSHFTYSIEIFITSKLLKKLWIKKHLVMLKNIKALQKWQSNFQTKNHNLREMKPKYNSSGLKRKT